MKLLDNYIFKTAAVVVVLFISIPLVMPSKEITITYEDGAVPVAAKSPFVRVFDRVADFYGFKAMTASAGRAPSDLEGQSFDIYGNPAALQKAENDLISSKNQIQHSYTGESGALNPAAGVSSVGGILMQSGLQHNLPAEPAPAKTGVERRALTFEGKAYDVITDAGNGKKYALTERGPVEIERLEARGAVYGGKKAASADSGSGAMVSRADYEARASSSSSGAASGGGNSGAGGGHSAKFRQNAPSAAGGADVSFANLLSAYENAKSQQASTRPGNAAQSSGGSRAQMAAQAAAAAKPPSSMAGDKEFVRDYYEVPSRKMAAIDPKQEKLTTKTMRELLPKTTVGAEFDRGLPAASAVAAKGGKAEETDDSDGF